MASHRDSIGSRGSNSSDNYMNQTMRVNSISDSSTNKFKPLSSAGFNTLSMEKVKDLLADE